MIAPAFNMALNGLSKPALSRREHQVASLVAEGLTNREIAERLFISERTADGHLEHIREKLAVNSRAQVAAWYVAQSLAGAPAVAAAPSPNRSALSVLTMTAVALVAVLVLAAVVLIGRQPTPAASTGPMITTVAGSRPVLGSLRGGYSGDYGYATSAELSYPSGLAVGPTGLLYIADTGNGAVRWVDHRGIINTLAGGGTKQFVEGGDGPTTSIGPVQSVAVSPDAVVYFTNTNFIARVDPDLSLHSVPSGPILSPWGICFAPDGTLYIADTFADKVWRRAPDGTLSVYAGSGTPGLYGDGGAATGAQLRYPTGLALDSHGNLYIADTGNNRIRRVDAASRVITTVAGSADTYGYSGDGGPADSARLSLPYGVAVGSNGDIFIADTGNNRVRRVDAKTELITTVVGTGSVGFAGDGAAAVGADLYGPYGVAVDSSGNLYVADSGNHRIRKITGGAGG
jgi:DNA-binding CsgD family transcriptional regulator/sugar lactone lactonase YvrE